MTSKEDTTDSHTFKVFKFDGSEPSKFREWKIKSMAYARCKKFYQGFTDDLSGTKKDESLVEEIIMRIPVGQKLKRDKTSPQRLHSKI